MNFPIKYEIIDYSYMVLGVLFMVGGAIIGIFRRRKNAKEAGYAEAESLYIEYLQSAVQHPLCASPEQEGIEYTPEMQARHAWFVSTMLYACDKILSASKDPVWEEVIMAQLQTHKTYLIGTEFVEGEEITWYGKELQKLYNSMYLADVSNKKL
jgi:hypothetical protein